MTNRDPSGAYNVGSDIQNNPDHSTVGENPAGMATNVKAPDFIPQGEVVGEQEGRTGDSDTMTAGNSEDPRADDTDIRNPGRGTRSGVDNDL